ncbi:MAG: hypothetical protein M1814_005893 [Vezdaea aestivalis]|nr:MAG: hypothetical protein M1814_005893 [Vezdaea aestivalis]
MDKYKVPERLPFSKKRLPVKVIVSYITDYVIIVVLVVAFSALDAVEPFHQHFSLQNYTLHYPFAEKERVPVPLAAFLSVGCPAIIIFIYTIIVDGIFSHHKAQGMPGAKRRLLNGRYRLKDRLWELNCGILGLLLSVGAAVTITGALKNATGKPRPDLIARCKPPAGTKDPDPFQLSTSDICDKSVAHAILKDGFRSFPSGHSSTAFAGLFYLSLYLAGKLHVFDNRGEVWKALIVLIPSLGAALIADSRIMDARHHPFDVITGSLLGIGTAWVSYRQYFGPITDSWRKGRAYPIRTWGRDPVHPAERQDSLYEKSVEPMRTPVRPDIEAANTSYEPSTDSAQGNVFREQVHRSQGQRRAEYGADAPMPSSSTGPYNPPNPYRSHPKPRGAEHDGYAASSSEDEASHDQGFELQQQYTLSDPHGTRDQFSGNETAYRGAESSATAPERVPGVLSATAQGLRNDAVSPVSDIMAPPAPPPQLLEQHASRKPVGLVETYAPGAK